MSILREYVEQAMAMATYDKLEDNTFWPHTDSKGVIAFGMSLNDCADELTFINMKSNSMERNATHKENPSKNHESRLLFILSCGR
jgi:uncharacterized protein (UPF0262 family)